jgi:hypothetical protein
MRANSSTSNFLTPSDSIEFKKWTKDDFINKLGFNDTAIALINLFFKKSYRGKNQTITGSAFLIGGAIALTIPTEKGDDQKGFGDLIKPAAEPGTVALGVLFTTSGLIKLKKYSKQELYSILLNYKNGTQIPEAYRKKLKRKYLPNRVTAVPNFKK